MKICAKGTSFSPLALGTFGDYMIRSMPEDLPKNPHPMFAFLRKRSRDYVFSPEDLKKAVRGTILFDESLAKFTTMRVGGPAEAIVFPTDFDDLAQTLAYAHERRIPVFIMGGGSNLLVKDGGIKGIVISLRDGFKNCVEIPRAEVE